MAMAGIRRLPGITGSSFKRNEWRVVDPKAAQALRAFFAQTFEWNIELVRLL